jgi:serine protease Do
VERFWKPAVLVCLVLAGAAVIAENPVNDDLYRRNTAEKIGRLLDEGKAATGATLRGQLTRTHAGLTLPSPSRKVLTPAAAYALRRSSVVVITGVSRSQDRSHWHMTTSAGFAITGAGVVATNYHVVANAETEALGVVTEDGRVYAVREVLAADQGADAAILLTDARNLKPIPLATGAATGSPVTCISHPDGRFYMLTTGVISRRYRERGELRLSITADYAKGSSGGPILDEAGNAVAMVASTESIYYDERDGIAENLQMVVKQCVPAEAIKSAAGK